MMTWRDALPIVLERTAVQRFRFLCSEANPNPRTREGYRRFVLESVVGKPERPAPAPRPSHTLAPVGDWSARIRACPDWHPGCCANPAPYCTRFNLHPSRERCIECLSQSEDRDGRP